MSQCRSKRQILILDCCNSGAFSRGTKAGKQKAITKSTFEGNGYGHVVLTASTETQFALEGDQVLEQTEFSLFTHFLLEGLNTGKADIDGDGSISLDELYEYTHSQVISKTPKQIPQKWGYQQQGELIIAKNPNLKKKLPVEILQAVESPIANVRIAIVKELSKLLQSRDVELSESAFNKLDYLKSDTHQIVSAAAKKAINEYENSFIGKSRKTVTRINEKITIAKKEPDIETFKPAPVNRITLSNGMEFMYVPAGKFLMGSKNKNKIASSDECPQHTVDIPYDYWMARFPVTNAQYNQFKGKKFEKEKENHPVLRVNWGDAMKYSQWLNQLLKAELPTGLFLRLPTETEWEKAARGGDGREYPWGNQFDQNKCNTIESGIGSTTPVGLFSPQGDSPYGCADMSGNVWEWTHSLHAPYPYKANDGRENGMSSELRAIRGGSFFIPSEFARCACRDGYLPVYGNRNNGFRITLSPALPS